MLCSVHPDCVGWTGLTADTTISKVSKHPTQVVVVLHERLWASCPGVSFRGGCRVRFPLTPSLGSKHLSGLPHLGGGAEALSPDHLLILFPRWRAEVKGSPGGCKASQTAELHCIPVCQSWASTAEEAERSSEPLVSQLCQPYHGRSKGS